MADRNFALDERNNGDLRPDGTKKGKGFLGELKRPDGKVSTELSFSLDIAGKRVLMPALVPTLTKEEIDFLLSTELPVSKWPMSIVRKAADHAMLRKHQGKSLFFENDEENKE